MLSRSWVRWLEKCFSGHQCYQSQVKKAGTYTALQKFLHFSFDWPTGKREFLFLKFFRSLNLKWKLALTSDLEEIFTKTFPRGSKGWLFGGISHPTKKNPHPRKIPRMKIPRFSKILNPLRETQSPGKKTQSPE